MEDIVVGLKDNKNSDSPNLALYCQSGNNNLGESYTICEIIKIINELTFNPQNNFKKRELIGGTF